MIMVLGTVQLAPDKLDGARACSIVYFGDGSASEGDFHEGANLAGVFTAPVILFCQNNGWAISVPTANQTAGEIWKRADGYGFPGVRVDGNDVLAVYRATRQAAERAYAGDGPTLIEALTYRVQGHSSSDDPSVYRDPKEPEIWEKKDPIKLVGAPANCTMAIERPSDGAPAAQKLGEENFMDGAAGGNFGAMFANKITVNCP